MLSRAGRGGEADAAFDRARELCEALVASDPAEPRFAHELARILGNWSASHSGGSRILGGIAALDRARKALESAAEDSPSNLILQADLAWIGTLIGRDHLDAGRDIEAVSAFERALAARDKLARARPTATRHVEQLVQLHYYLAEIHEHAGRSAAARSSYESAISIGERGIRAFPSDLALYEQLAYPFEGWVRFLAAQGEAAEARSACERMRAVVNTLVEASASAFATSRRAGFLRRLGTAMGATGRAEEAVAHYRRSLAMLETEERPTPVNLYDMACCRSLIAGAATVAGSGLTAAEGRLEADRAVAGLRLALDAGYARIGWIRKDPDLDPIRSRTDFQLLMMDREFPDEPFVVGR